MALATRLNTNGNLQVGGSFDELSIGVGSINLNGTSSYLSTTSMPAPGSGSITYECWFNTTTVGARVQTILNNRSGNTSDGLDIQIASAKINVTNSGGVKYTGASGTTIVANTWYHLAVVRTGASSFAVYVNGVLDGTFSDTTNITSTTFTVGFTPPSGTSYFSGYISNVRIAYEAVYSAAFTPSQSLLPATTNTKLLLNVLNSTTFINDNSTSKLALTNNGSAAWIATGPFNRGVTSLQQRQINDGSLQVASTFDEVTNNPSAMGSLFFDGTSGYLTIPYNSYFNFNSGSSVSFEAWVYPTSYTNPIFLASRNWSYGATGPTWGFRVSSATSIDWTIAGTGSSTYILLANTTLSGASTVPLNSWSHVAFTRDTSGNAKIFVNGYLVAARTDSQTLASASGPVYIGIPSSGGNYSKGYISNLRLVSNNIPVAYQTSNTTLGTQIFTPPIQPPNAIANTQLLINPPNTPVNNILDTSTNAATITKNGTVTISPQTPLKPNGYYGYYFNSATPDFLMTPGSATNLLTSGDFTIEAWVYAISTGATSYGIVTITDTASSGGSGISVYLNSNGSMSFFVNGNGSGKVVTSSASAFSFGAWHHVALVRSSTTNTLYLDGVSIGSNALTPTGPAAPPIGIGRTFNDNTSITWNGYISNLRIVNGTAVYTANFTPPSIRLTTIPNTVLLTCQSNTIVDKSTTATAITRTSGSAAVNSNTLPFSSYVYDGSNVAVQRLSSSGTLQVSGVFDEYNKPV
jgi:hypothetical protein